MRAKEFISEDRQKLDEIAPLIWVAGLGWMGYETAKNVNAYRKGEITGKELTARVGTDIAATAAGGLAGKVVGKAAVGTGRAIAKKSGEIKDTVKNKWQDFKNWAFKDKADPTKKPSSLSAPKPGSTIQTPKGPRVAGVDGKPTVIDPTKRGARADIKKIKQAAKKQPASKATATGAAVSGAAAKVVDGPLAKVVKTGSTVTGAALGKPIADLTGATEKGREIARDLLGAPQPKPAAVKKDPATTGPGSDYTYTGKDFKSAPKSDFKAKVTKW